MVNTFDVWVFNPHNPAAVRIGIATTRTAEVALRKVCADDLAEVDGERGVLKDGRKVVAMEVGVIPARGGEHDAQVSRDN